MMNFTAEIAEDAEVKRAAEFHDDSALSAVNQ